MSIEHRWANWNPVPPREVEEKTSTRTSSTKENNNNNKTKMSSSPIISLDVEVSEMKENISKALKEGQIISLSESFKSKYVNGTVYEMNGDLKASYDFIVQNDKEDDMKEKQEKVKPNNINKNQSELKEQNQKNNEKKALPKKNKDDNNENENDSMLCYDEKLSQQYNQIALQFMMDSKSNNNNKNNRAEHFLRETLRLYQTHLNFMISTFQLFNNNSDGNNKNNKINNVVDLSVMIPKFQHNSVSLNIKLFLQSIVQSRETLSRNICKYHVLIQNILNDNKKNSQTHSSSSAALQKNDDDDMILIKEYNYSILQLTSFLHLFTMTHNLALIFLSCGKINIAKHILLSIYSNFILSNQFNSFDSSSLYEKLEKCLARKSTDVSSSTSTTDQTTTTTTTTTTNRSHILSISDLKFRLDQISCRVVFLILDCVLALHKGDPVGLPKHIFSMNELGLDWEKVTKTTSSSQQKTDNTEESDKSSTSNTATDDDDGKASKQDNIVVTDESLLLWIESFIERCKTQTTVISQSNESGDREAYESELKFRLHLYKARILFLSSSSQQKSLSTQNNNNNNTTTTSNATTNKNHRQSKKEMKAALEIFQHKLRPRKNEHEMVNTVGDDGSTIEAPVDTSSSFSPSLSNMQNQYALYLKANMEYIKHNYKKSIVLCNEAKMVGERNRNRTTTQTQHRYNHQECDQKNNDEEEKVESTQSQSQSVVVPVAEIDLAIHFSNLGCVLQSTGRLHMALHFYQKALSNYTTYCTTSQSSQAPAVAASSYLTSSKEGIPRIFPIHEIYHNISLCYLQLKNWSMAYYYLSKAIVGSPDVFSKRPKSWLRLAECCIGINESLKKNHKQQQHGRSFEIQVTGGQNGIFPRLVVQPNHETRKNDPMTQTYKTLNTTTTTTTEEKEEEDKKESTTTTTNIHTALGTIMDLEQVKKSPLPRALSSLRLALALLMSHGNSSSKSNSEEEKSNTTTTTTTNSRELAKAECIESCQLSLSYVLLELCDYHGAIEMAQKVQSPSSLLSSSSTPLLQQSLSKRRKATAKLYECEAFCHIGKPHDAIQCILNKKKQQQQQGEEKEKSEADLTILKTLAHDLGMIDLLSVPSQEKDAVYGSMMSTSHLMASNILLRTSASYKNDNDNNVSNNNSEYDTNDSFNQIMFENSIQMAEKNALLSLKYLMASSDSPSLLGDSSSFSSLSQKEKLMKESQIKETLLVIYIYTGETKKALSLLQSMK